MGWKHEQSHPRTSTSNNLSSNVHRQRTASTPSLQLGCEVACQLPSRWTSSVCSAVASFGGGMAELWHADDGFIWDARWHLVCVCVCVCVWIANVFWEKSQQRWHTQIRYFHIPQDDRETDRERGQSEAQSITSEEVCQVYCTVQTGKALWPTSLKHTHTLT